MRDRFEHGINVNLPEGIYRSDPAINQSYLKDVLERSVLHARIQRQPTAAMRLGTAVHCAVLEPDVFAAQYVDGGGMPPKPEGDGRKKEVRVAREAWAGEIAAWEAAHEGMDVLTESEWVAVQGMKDALERHREVAAMFSVPHVCESSLKWDDAETGITCKARLDYYSEEFGIAGDLKTTQDASPAAIARSVAKWGYHVQAGFYLDGLRELTGRDCAFHFIFVESSAPHGVVVAKLSESACEFGLQQARLALWKHQEQSEQIEGGVLQPYTQELIEIDLPHWAYRQNEYQS